jgi:hypothetical protein
MSYWRNNRAFNLQNSTGSLFRWSNLRNAWRQCRRQVYLPTHILLPRTRYRPGIRRTAEGLRNHPKKNKYLLILFNDSLNCECVVASTTAEQCSTDNARNWKELSEVVCRKPDKVPLCPEKRSQLLSVGTFPGTKLIHVLINCLQENQTNKVIVRSWISDRLPSNIHSYRQGTLHPIHHLV